MRMFPTLIAFTLLPIAFAFAGELQTAIMDLRNIQCYACFNTVKKAL